MVFDLFKKKNDIVADVVPVQSKKVMGKTSKKKNTYTLKLDNILADINMFSMCQKAPLAVIKLNGRAYSDDSDGWLNTVLFENPFAIETANGFKKNKEIFGEKIATTIIEYRAWNAKKDEEPVITVYPAMFGYNGETIEEALAKLNHATRRDCLYQMRLRMDLMKKYCENNR